MNKIFDVIIVGGSFSGLSAALSLARCMRRVLILDAGRPCNRFAAHAQNFLGHDGEAPLSMLQKAREQLLEHYPEQVTFLNKLAVRASRNEKGIYEIGTQEDEQVHRSRKVILSHGVQDILPDIPNLSSAWGRNVIHCPFCHGHEHRFQKTGLLLNGDHAQRVVAMIQSLTQDVTIFTNGSECIVPNKEQIQKKGIRIVETPITSAQINSDSELESLTLSDGTNEKLDALYVEPKIKQPEDLLQQLTVDLNQHGLVEVNPMAQTSADGVYACGDCANGMRSIAMATSDGQKAGAVCHMMLGQEDLEA